MSSFIQIHALTGYSGVLLNRDDTGMAKRLPYGDSVRTRISSQFIKRKLREAQGAYSLSSVGDLAVRSRNIFRTLIAQPLIDLGHAQERVVPVVVAVMNGAYPVAGKVAAKAKAAKPAKGKKGGDEEVGTEPAANVSTDMVLLERAEVNVLGAAEISYLRSLCEDALNKPDGEDLLTKLLASKDFKDNLTKLAAGISPDVAIGGRMITGDVLSTVDAALHVAHGLTIHAQATEIDYFTAVDDLMQAAGESGAGHVGESELTSPLMYTNYVLDIGLLHRNLMGADNTAEMAGTLARNLVHLVSTAIVGAKKGGTAPYSRAAFVLVEIGNEMPRTLAEAFRGKVKGTMPDGIAALRTHLEGEANMYGPTTGRRFVAALSSDGLGEVFGQKTTLAAIADEVATAVSGYVAGA